MKTSIHLTDLAILLACTAVLQAASTNRFAASSYTVAEWEGAVTLTVLRLGDTNTIVSVDFATADGTATNGLKYIAVSGTLTFASGETNQAVVVPILNDGFVGSSKTFRVILSNPSSGAVLSGLTNATVFITDNDAGIQFVLATSSVAEDAGAVLIGVVRGDDGNLPVTVHFATADGTATSGLDYTGLTNTLSFASAERLKFVSVPILNNSLKQPNRSFSMTLRNPTGGMLGGMTTTTVTIADNDPGFQFESASYTVAEDAGAALLRVLRGTDAANSTATVDYATADGTATSGPDYTGTNGTLSFAPGEQAKVLPVLILNDGVNKPSRSFQVTLSNPTGGAVLGMCKNATVTILDNDPGVGFDLTNYTSAWGTTGMAVTVLRGNDGVLAPITVDYATSDQTAKAGQDYQAIAGTLPFQANETVKSLTIPLLRNRTGEGAKAFRVTLSNPTGGATLKTSVTTVNIAGAFFTMAPPFDTALSIRRDLGLNTLTWTGGGRLQKADGVTGPWTALPAARSPTAVQSPVPATFYRIASPRPENLYVPSGHDSQRPMPLVILLHMLTYTGDMQEGYMQFRPLAEKRGFLYCYPDGTINQLGYNFWNATDTCCDFWNTGVDDAGYLRGVIEEIARRFAVDRKRIYLVGHLNGGFMAYRMACQSADLIAGIASMNGATFLESNRYAPSESVNILHIHTTDDPVVPYGGGILNIAGIPNMPPFPGAKKSVQIWAGYNGSSGPITETMRSMDLVQEVPGFDTVVTRYTSCPPGGAVELWTINGGGHIPTLSSEFSPRVIDWLLAHPKP